MVIKRTRSFKDGKARWSWSLRRFFDGADSLMLKSLTSFPSIDECEANLLEVYKSLGTAISTDKTLSEKRRNE